MQGSSFRIDGRMRAAAFALVALVLAFAGSTANPASAYAYDQNASGAVAKVTGNGHDGHSVYAHSVKDAMNAVGDMISTTNNPLHEDDVTIDLMADWNTKDYGLLKFEKSGYTYTVNLHGYMINRDEAEANGKWYGKGNGEVIKVYKGVTVNIDGGASSDETAREHTGYIYEDYFWKASGDNRGNPFYGGLITGGICDDENGAGGIAVMGSATLNLSNVTVAGNIADTYASWWGYGGGISLLGNSAKLTMSNAKVMYNHAERTGGGVYVKSAAEKCEIKLSNSSEVSSNYSGYGGAGICDKGYNTKIDISGSALKNNHAAGEGGAIGLFQGDDEETHPADKGPTVYVYRSTISGNTSEGSGGAIGSLKLGSQITLHDTAVDSNTSGSSGGGVYLLAQDKLTTYGSTSITNNKASAEGGGIASERPSGYGNYKDSVNISLGGTTVVSGNTAANGGGIYYYSTTYLTFSTNDVVVENNTASKNGGGIYGTYGGFLKNIYVRGNHANGVGGGFYYSDRVNSRAHTSMDTTQLGGRVIIESNTQGTGSSKAVSNLYLCEDSYLEGTTTGLTTDSRIGFSSEKTKSGGREITAQGDTALTQKIKNYSARTKILYADDAQNYYISFNGSSLNLYTGEDKAVSTITATVKTETDTKSATKTYYRGEELVLKSSDWGDPEYWLVEGFNGEKDSFKLYPSGEGDEKCVKLGTCLSTSYTATAIYPNTVKSLALTINESTSYSELKASASSEDGSAEGASATSLTIADSKGDSHEADASKVTVDTRRVKDMTTGYSLGVYYQITVPKKVLDDAGVVYVAKTGSYTLPIGTTFTVNAQLKGATTPVTLTESGAGSCGYVTTDANGNLVITTAQFRFDNHVDVTYANYFEGGKAYTRSVVYGSAVNTTPVPQIKADGKVFKCWSYDEAGEKLVADGDTVTGDVTLYPQYVEAQGTVRAVYYMDGDTEIGADFFDGDDEGTVTNPGDPSTNTSGLVYSKEGYKFEGWYTDQTCETEATFPITVTSAAPEVKLYSKWTRKTLYVTFMASGQASKTYSVDYGSTLSESLVPKDPTLTGYTFYGWYPDADESKDAFEYNHEFTENTVYVACFARNDYLVTFDLDGGKVDGTILDTDTIGDDGIYRRISLYGSTLGELPVPKKDGFTFKGWYYNGQLLSADTIVTENIFAFTEPNAASGASAIMLTALTGEDGQDDAQQGTVDGKVTAAWEKDDSSDDSADLFVEVKDPSASEDEDDSLGGVYVSDGDALDQDDLELAFGGDEYTILGWYTDAKCTKAFDFSQTLTEDTVLYVKREKKSHTVTFSTGDGASKVDAQTVKFGELPSKPADPTRSGYTFAGWYADEGCTIEYKFGSKSMAIECDVTLYAKWEKSSDSDVTPDDDKKDDSSKGEEDESNKGADSKGKNKKSGLPRTGDENLPVALTAGLAAMAAAMIAVALHLKRRES